MLTTQAVAERGLAWSPLRTDLLMLAARWNALAESATGEERRNRALLVRGLLQDLIAAVDAENDAIATGQDWRLLRPRVNEAERGLADALVAQPLPTQEL